MKNIIKELYDNPAQNIEQTFIDHGITDDDTKRQIWIALHEQVDEALIKEQSQQGQLDFSRPREIINRIEHQYLDMKHLHPEQHIYQSRNSSLLMNILQSEMNRGKDMLPYKPLFQDVMERGDFRGNEGVDTALLLGWVDCVPDHQLDGLITRAAITIHPSKINKMDMERMAQYDHPQRSQALVNQYILGAQCDIADFHDKIDFSQVDWIIVRNNTFIMESVSHLHTENHKKWGGGNKHDEAAERCENIYQKVERFSNLNFPKDCLNYEVQKYAEIVIKEIVSLDKLTGDKRFPDTQSKALSQTLTGDIDSILNHPKTGYHTLSERAQQAIDRVIPLLDNIKELQYLQSDNIETKPVYLSEQLYGVEYQNRYIDTSHQEQEIYL